VIKADGDASDRHEGFEGAEALIPSYSDAAVLVHPSICAFEFPAALIFSGSKAASRSSLFSFAVPPDAAGNDRPDEA